MLAVGLYRDDAPFWIGALLELSGWGALIVTLRPGWTFARWRKPSWLTALRRLTLQNRTAWIALAMIVGGFALQVATVPPDPTEHLASGVSEGVAWSMYVKEVEHVTCLELRGQDAVSDACGRPHQPRRMLSAVRMALREGNRDVHFILGTAPEGVEYVRIQGRPAVDVTLGSWVFTKKRSFPFRFFIAHIPRTTTGIIVDGLSVENQRVARIRVPDRPQHVSH